MSPSCFVTCWCGTQYWLKYDIAASTLFCLQGCSEKAEVRGGRLRECTSLSLTTVYGGVHLPTREDSLGALARTTLQCMFDLVPLSYIQNLKTHDCAQWLSTYHRLGVHQIAAVSLKRKIVEDLSVGRCKHNIQSWPLLPGSRAPQLFLECMLIIWHLFIESRPYTLCAVIC